jgi:transposase
MESTGVLWRPIYAVLEDQFELLRAFAHEIKALAGRKTDVRDGEWIAERYAAWFDPPQFHSCQAGTRAARSDALSQKSGLSAHSAHQSVTQSLETATIKLTSVVSDVWGKSGQSMIKAIR